tara:strand:- start:1441 stop:1854 length:414 start_codon:yes stop_codon:yes gene_type:complete
MPLKDLDKRRQYQKEKYEKNKESIRQQAKEWREKPENKEKKREQDKKYREKYKDKIKAHGQTPAGIKSRRIKKWKYRGIICDDWDVLYERYLNTKFCEECNVELTSGKSKTSRCLDHDHETGEVRNILCNPCNIKRG